MQARQWKSLKGLSRHGQKRAASTGVIPLLLLLAVFLFLPPSLPRAEGLPVPEARNARVTGNASAARFEADLTYAIPFNVYVVADPYRVVIDMPAVDFRFGEGAGRRGRGLVRSFRYGRIAEDKARIVLDVDGPVLIRNSWVHHATADRPARMGVELVRTTPDKFAELTGASSAREKGEKAETETGSGNDDPAAHVKEGDEAGAAGMATAFRHLVEEALRWRPARPAVGTPGSIEDLLKDEPLLPGGIEKAAAAGSSPEEKTASAGRTHTASGSSANGPKKDGKPRKALSSVRPLVVIDPGHGGKDPGAIGWKGVREKDLVLRFALDLRRMLEKAGYRVRMTRSSDRFLTLAERVEFARRHDAHLFISIHADKFRTGTAQGLAVYTLSEEASDAEAAELARSENAADIIDGVDLGAGMEAVRDILIDLALRETKNQSVHFARLLTRAVRPAARLRPRPVRSANFRVLRNPEVPAVLVELGYVSNPRDVRNMQSRAWRRRLAAALARAVDRYFRQHLAWQEK
jgi:N-acetylmuramoyl-L-alanine amidase